MSVVSPSPPESIDLGDVLYEVVNGQVVEMPPMGSYQVWLAAVLVEYLAPFARAQELGRVVPEMLFLIDRGRNLQRRPDVAFVSYERWPRERRVPDQTPWDVVPDLAIEVNSPSNKGDELVARVREYFHAGVKRVWTVYPYEALVYDYQSFTDVRIVDHAMSLEGDPILPGFRLPLLTLFEEQGRNGIP